MQGFLDTVKLSPFFSLYSMQNSYLSISFFGGERLCDCINFVLKFAGFFVDNFYFFCSTRTHPLSVCVYYVCWKPISNQNCHGKLYQSTQEPC